MTAPSSTPRGEHTPRPGATWETSIVWHEEHVIADDDLTLTPAPSSDATWMTSTAWDDEPAATAVPQPTANRATRRALARAARRKT